MKLTNRLGVFVNNNIQKRIGSSIAKYGTGDSKVRYPEFPGRCQELQKIKDMVIPY